MSALSRHATADDFKPQNFPDCKKHKLADGTEICGYTDLEEWKSVLKADLELTAKKETLAIRTSQVDELRGQVENFKGQIEVLERIVAEKDSRNKEITTDLLETDRKYQFERVKPKWGNPLAWTAAALATAVLGGFILKDTL